MVRELFVMARESAPAIIFMDEIDSIGSSRSEEGGSGGGDSEVQRTMLELLNQLDGFEQESNIKVIMATNRIDILDDALLRPGRIDRKVEIPHPNEEARIAREAAAASRQERIRQVRRQLSAAARDQQRKQLMLRSDPSLAKLRDALLRGAQAKGSGGDKEKDGSSQGAQRAQKGLDGVRADGCGRCARGRQIQRRLDPGCLCDAPAPHGLMPGPCEERLLQLLRDSHMAPAPLPMTNSGSEETCALG